MRVRVLECSLLEAFTSLFTEGEGEGESEGEGEGEGQGDASHMPCSPLLGLVVPAS